MSPFTSTIKVRVRGSRGPVEPPLPAAATLAPGYTVVSHLSRNRTLDVYDVWSAERECRCIAKTLPPHLRHDRRAARRLLREGDFLLALAHPHIVRAYETIRRPNPVVILETLTGETLGRLVERRQRRLSTRELSYLGLHVASAVTTSCTSTSSPRTSSAPRARRD
jgi:serine/threonine protein kinase